MAPEAPVIATVISMCSAGWTVDLTACGEGIANQLFWRSGTVWLPLPLGEGWGEGLSANCSHNVAAGFSPQSVQGFFAASTSFKNQLVVSLDNGLKPGELIRACRTKPSPRPSPKRRRSQTVPPQPDTLIKDQADHWRQKTKTQPTV